MTSHPRRPIPTLARRFASTLGASLLLFASCTTAQAQLLRFETSEGNFSVQLFDEPAHRAHPDVAAHIAEFRRRNPPGTHMAFHHSDVLTCDPGDPGDEDDLDCFFFCECIDARGVCDGDPAGEKRACDPIGAILEVDGDPCTCIPEPIIAGVCDDDDDERACAPDRIGTTYELDGKDCMCIEGDDLAVVCKDDESRTCEPPGDSFWVDTGSDERLASSLLYPSPFTVDEHNHLGAPDDWMDKMPPEFKTQPGIWSNIPLTLAFVRDLDTCLPADAESCEDILTCELTGEWIINLHEENAPNEAEPNDFDDCHAKAYLVVGSAIIGDTAVLDRIANFRTFDASADPAVVADLGDGVPPVTDFAQVPVVDSFFGEPGTFITPCGGENDPVCAMPECEELSANGLSCLEPRCLELQELDEEPGEGEEVPRFCEGPLLPSFPLLVPEPSNSWLQGAALLSLAALAASRRRASRRR